MSKNRFKHTDPEKLQQVVRELLETPFWLESISTQDMYRTTSDDDRDTFLTLCFSMDGDAHIRTLSEFHNSVRFRTFQGGGRQHRTRAALMILAEAMRLDAEGERRIMRRTIY